MNRKVKIAFFLHLIFGIVAIAAVILFADEIAVLSPKGMVGQKEYNLMMISVYLMLVVVIPVFVLTFFIAWKYRASNKKAEYTPNWDYNFALEVVWWGIPCIIIVILGIFNWKGCVELDPFRPIEGAKRIKIQAVALQWKWLFIYPEQGIATVNFAQFPEKTALDFEITADAPMNSFWIPRLGGQIYAMPGMRSKLHLISSGPDRYFGCSANLSGDGFSGMKFAAVSSTQEDFDQWVESVRGSSGVLTKGEYEQLVKPSSYDSASFYRLGENGLFDQIIMKYMSSM